MIRPITGRKMFLYFGLAFGVIIAANITLAVNAIKTFPGLEVRNSYVASQSFDDDRSEQLALGWNVSATVSADELILMITDADGAPVDPEITSAVFGMATSVMRDQSPVFAFDGNVHRAVVDGGPGNWNLRLAATAADGSHFQQRVIVTISR